MRGRNRTYDTQLVLGDGLAAMTASGYAQNAGSDGVVDFSDASGQGTLGEGPNVTGELVIDISAIKISANDEAYTFVLVGAPTTDFSDATVLCELARLHVGAKETKVTPVDKDDEIGRYFVPFSNEQNGTVYGAAKLYVVTEGTSETITFEAFLAAQGI